MCVFGPNNLLLFILKKLIMNIHSTLRMFTSLSLHQVLINSNNSWAGLAEDLGVTLTWVCVFSAPCSHIHI